VCTCIDSRMILVVMVVGQDGLGRPGSLLRKKAPSPGQFTPRVHLTPSTMWDQDLEPTWLEAGDTSRLAVRNVQRCVCLSVCLHKGSERHPSLHTHVTGAYHWPVSDNCTVVAHLLWVAGWGVS
jgi:hypothetical protein